MMRTFRFLLTLFFVAVFCGLFGVACFAAEQKTSDAVTETPLILYEKGDRWSSIGDYDSTNDYVFFAYSEKISVVDAYHMNGSFAFSINFDIDKHGAISLRCENGLLYVMTKKGNVFIFEGDRKIGEYAEGDAVALGYNWQWFEGKTRNIELLGISFFTADQEGKYTNSIALPFDVVLGTYSSYSLHVAIALALVLTIYRKRKK